METRNWQTREAYTFLTLDQLRPTVEKGVAGKTVEQAASWLHHFILVDAWPHINVQMPVEGYGQMERKNIAYAMGRFYQSLLTEIAKEIDYTTLAENLLESR